MKRLSDKITAKYSIQPSGHFQRHPELAAHGGNQPKGNEVEAEKR